jgi:hypothetical protein
LTRRAIGGINEPQANQRGLACGFILFWEPFLLGIRNWWSSLTEQRKSLYLALIALILLTLPCYCLGFIALQMIQPGVSETAPTPAALLPASSPSATLAAATPVAAPSATATIFPTPSRTPVPSPTATTTLTPTASPVLTAKPNPIALPTATPGAP